MRAFHLGRPRVRPVLFALTLIVSGPTFAQEPAAGAKKTISAIVDRAQLLKVPKETDTLIIGNATIADVSLLPNKGLAVLLAKSFGETNFIALDDKGNVLAESIINVANSDNGALVVQRGASRQSYSCAPQCQPTENLGDDGKYMQEVAAQAIAHNSRVTGTVAPTAVPLAPTANKIGTDTPPGAVFAPMPH